MKGPFERLKYDLRRVWECTECHHHERTSGAFTGWWCTCQQQKGRPARPMKLLEDGVRRVLPPQPSPPESTESAGEPAQ